MAAGSGGSAHYSLSGQDLKLYDLKDSSGRVFAFEVGNALLGRQGLCRVVNSIPGVRIVRRPRRWTLFDDDRFCEFTLREARFVAWEPWGDSSRYWVGPVRWVPELEPIRNVFRDAPPLFGFMLPRRSHEGKPDNSPLQPTGSADS